MAIMRVCVSYAEHSRAAVTTYKFGINAAIHLQYTLALLLSRINMQTHNTLLYLMDALHLFMYVCNPRYGTSAEFI